jgi:ABC-type polar amino acid transport system ATPase subunit
VLVSKPPAPEVADEITAYAESLGTPVELALLGPGHPDLTAAAARVLTHLGRDVPDWPGQHVSWSRVDGKLRGLFVGGTLCQEARLIAGATLGPDVGTFVDFGDDEYTQGRAHPMIDGQDVRSVTQGSLREQFGVVSQDAMLMHRSIRDNIGYGRAEASQAEIEDAARRSAAHEFIRGISDPKGRRGYDAHVGERGVKLSGGQRQRVAIARMMLKDAPILILDEATSALDSEVEAAIQDNLYRLMEGKTVIAIAHRLSTIAALDRLIVLDKGRIVEEGTHEALIARGGLYAQLWKRQSGGFLADQLAAE